MEGDSDMNAVTILLVDDIDLFRRGVKAWLKGLGCHVREYSDGDQALQAALAGEEFDVVLTDWLMPNMKGDELIEKLRENGFEQPAVLWSASIPLPQCDKADMVVHKSVGLPGITLCLRKVLGIDP